MKIGRWARFLLAAAPLAFSGCGNFWQSPSNPTNPDCTTNCPTTTSGNFYVLNQGTNQIAGFNIASGTLTSLSGSPYALSAKPFAIAIAPGGGFLYVSTAAGIYLYNIDSSTGALTVGNSGGVISTDFATTMQVDSTSSWLVEAGADLAEVLAVSIDPSTGLIGSGQEQHANLPADTLEQLVLSPDNSNVFITLGTNGTVVIPFTSTNTNPFGGTYTRLPVKKTSGSALSVAVDPTNRVFYVGETLAGSGTNPGGLRVFDYTTLVEETGSPYSTNGLAPNVILPDASGDYVYVANGQGATTVGTVGEFTITASATSVTLKAGASVNVGDTPVGLAEDSTGTYVMAISSGGNPDLAAFSFDATTLGALDTVLTSTTGTGTPAPSAIVAMPQ